MRWYHSDPWTNKYRGTRNNKNSIYITGRESNAKHTMASGHQKRAILFLYMEVLQFGQGPRMTRTYDRDLPTLVVITLFCHARCFNTTSVAFLFYWTLDSDGHGCWLRRLFVCGKKTKKCMPLHWTYSCTITQVPW